MRPASGVVPATSSVPDARACALRDVTTWTHCESGSFAGTHRAVAYIRESRYVCHLFGTTRRRRGAHTHTTHIISYVFGAAVAPQFPFNSRSATPGRCILRRRARSVSFHPQYPRCRSECIRGESSPWTRAPYSERTSTGQPDTSRATIRTRARRSRICFGLWAACAACTTSTWAGIYRACCGGAPSADTLASVGSGTCSTLASTWPTPTTTRNTWRKSITWFAYTKRLVELIKINVRLYTYLMLLLSQYETKLIDKLKIWRVGIYTHIYRCDL